MERSLARNAIRSSDLKIIALVELVLFLYYLLLPPLCILFENHFVEKNISQFVAASLRSRWMGMASTSKELRYQE